MQIIFLTTGYIRYKQARFEIRWSEHTYMQQWRFLVHRSKLPAHHQPWLGYNYPMLLHCNETRTISRYCNKNGEKVREGRKGYETSAVRRKKYLWSMDSGNWNGVHTLPGQNGSTEGGGNCLWSFLSPNLNSALREKRRKGENWIGKLPVELGEEQNGGDWRESNREEKKGESERWALIQDERQNVALYMNEVSAPRIELLSLITNSNFVLPSLAIHITHSDVMMIMTIIQTLKHSPRVYDSIIYGHNIT